MGAVVALLDTVVYLCVSTCCCDVLMFVVHTVCLCVLLCACCVGPQCGGSVGSCPTSCQ